MAETSQFLIEYLSRGQNEAVAASERVSAALGRTASAASGIVSPSQAASKATDDLANKQDKNTKATNRAAAAHENYFVHIAKTTIQSALVNKAFLGLADAAGQAVKQTDLIAQFPAQMQALGLSAKDASTGLSTLRSYVQGVGGDLVKAASTVTRFAGVTKNVHAAVAEYAGLNNALIAGGASADVQASALEQLTQAYSRGRPQAIEFKSALVAMAPQLGIVAKAMNFSSATALGDALTTGKVSMQDFLTELTKLSTGTGPIAKQVAVQMTGIGFATNQMKAALVNGLTAIYQAVGRENIVNFMQFLTQVIGVLASFVVILINDLISLFNILSSVFNGPQIKHFNGEAQGAANALGDAAGNAGDTADGLGDAADNAAALNKSLASFDKMNVLDKGKAATPAAAGQNGIDPATAAQLEDVFSGIGTGIKNASEGAKIFAGILASLAGIKFAQALIGQVDGVVKSFQTASKGIQSFKTFLAGDGEEKANIFSRAGSGISSLVTGISGLAAGGVANLKVFTNPWVLLAVAIAAVVAGIIYLYNTNEDFRKGFNAAWNGFIDAVKNTGDFIRTSFGAVLKWLEDRINALPKPFKGAFDAIGKVVKDVGGFFGDLAKKIGITGPPMEVLGKAAGVLAVAVTVLTAAWGIYQLVMIGVTAVTTAFGVVMAIITSPITLVILAIVALVAIVYLLITHWQDVAKFAGIAWDFIVSVFAGAAKWFYDTVITPIVLFFKGMWDGIMFIFSVVGQFFLLSFQAAVDAIKFVFSVVVDFFKAIFEGIKLAIEFYIQIYITAFQLAWAGIKLAFSFAVQFFKDVWTGIGAAFGAVVSFFSGVFSGAWNAIKSAFSAVGSFFGGVWDTVKNIFSKVGSTVGDAVGNAFKTAVNAVLGFLETEINGIVDIVNGALAAVDRITPGSLPRLPRVAIPRLAQGGIVNQATMAIIGESGSEAVMPLENNTEWIDTLASKLNNKANDGQPVQLVVQIGEDKVASKIINLINEKTNMSGKNVIYV